MNKMYVVQSLQYRLEDAPESARTSVEELGFSVVRLMKLSGQQATGVRANLQIQNQEVLNELARHYAENARLSWTFHFGGGANAFTVALRWTKFDRLSGNLQVVRTAVLRDLIREAEGPKHVDDEHESAEALRGDESSRSADEQYADEQTETSQKASRDSSSSGLHLVQHVSDLWPVLLGENGRLTPNSTNRDQ